MKKPYVRTNYMFKREISRQQMLEYEVASSWFAEYISWDWLQSVVARYYAWKVRRKARNYDAVMKRKAWLAQSLIHPNQND